MRVLHLIPLSPLAAALSSTNNAHNVKRVGIIGAGASGSSAAFHLAQYAGEADIRTNVTVYERNAYVGGRTTTVNVWNDPGIPVELGGSIFVEVNHILVEASERFNLSNAQLDLASQLELPDLGIWNGEEFVIITRAEDSWWDKAKLLWRYGTAPLWTNRLMKGAVGKFLTMYDEPVFPWKSLSDVVQRVGLLEVTGVTGEQYLKTNGIGEAFAREIIQASTRVNYASNLPYIHGLETMVCMATSGAMAIEGGNWQIFANMLKSSHATTHIKTHLNTTVTKVSKQHDGTYVVSTNTGETTTFDEVILAAPLQYAKLAIDPAPKHVPDEIPYTKLHVTLFASPFALDPKVFRMDAGKAVPQFVLTTLPPSEMPADDVGSPGFYSISIVNQVINPRSSVPRLEYIYKIFSPERIGSDFLSNILGHAVTGEEAKHGDVDGTVSWIHHKVWHAYPKEYPRVTFEEIKLDHGLWYTSGIESFISTMETSALSGKNIARLIRDEWIASKGGVTNEEKESKVNSESKEQWQEEL